MSRLSIEATKVEARDTCARLQTTRRFQRFNAGRVEINWTRVLLGGLLAGVIINAFEFVTNGVVLASQWEATMKALGRSISESALAAFMILGFLIGITAVLLYARARPRFGSGAKTAVLTAFVLWIIGYALPSLGFSAMGWLPKRFLLVGTIVGLVEVILASVAGAWVYEE
jgi:hypothetical protein